MEQEIEAPVAGRNADVLVRTFAAHLAPADGRTVDVRIVPYGEVITHNDGFGDVPKGVSYREEWLPGVFSHQLNAANRVHANFEHEQGISGIVGKGLALREEPDGFHGSFKLLATQAGDTMLELLREGAVDGVSLEARPVKNVKASSGVLQRAKANLYGIAFTRFSAYSGARVLALREEDNEEASTTFAEGLLPVEIDPEVAARIQRLGLALPVRTEPVVVRAQANPVVTLRQCVGMLRAYIAAEPDAADKSEAQGVLSTLEKLMAKDMQEGEAAA